MNAGVWDTNAQKFPNIPVGRKLFQFFTALIRILFLCWTVVGSSLTRSFTVWLRWFHHHVVYKIFCTGQDQQAGRHHRLRPALLVCQGDCFYKSLGLTVYAARSAFLICSAFVRFVLVVVFGPVFELVVRTIVACCKT